MSDLRHHLVGRAFLRVRRRRLRPTGSRSSGGERFAGRLESLAAFCGLLRTDLAAGAVVVAYVPSRREADSPRNEASSPSRRARRSSSRSTDKRGCSVRAATPAASSLIQEGTRASVPSGWI